MLDDLFLENEEKMEKTFEHLKHGYGSLRTGRASTALLENIKVDYYGSMTPISQVATISVPEPRLIVIQPWEKNLLSAVEKSILKSDLGLNPQNDGQVIRVPIPAMTEERRKELVKIIHKMTEDARVSARNTRRDANEKIKNSEKAGELSKDNAADCLDKIQELTNTYIEKFESVMKVKEKEILED